MNSFVCRDLEPYTVGESRECYDPSKEVYRNMLRLVAYDIADAKRLRKVSLLCLDYGFRVEYSVFECDLSEKDFQLFWKRLNEIITPEEDRIIVYRFCANCVSGILSAGKVTRPERPLVYVM